MNCIIHHDATAVATCGACGGGICGTCVQNAVQMQDGKTYCKNCATQSISAYVAELKRMLGQLRVKQIVWTIIFVIGAAVVLYNAVTYNPNSDSAFFLAMGILIWALAGATERFVVKSAGEQVFDAHVQRDAMRGEGYVWIVWAMNIAFWLVKNLARGVIFPFIYAYFMLTGTKKVKTEIAQQEQILAELANAE